MKTYNCPGCDHPVEFEVFADDFPCPHCGVLLATEHDCQVDSRTGDSLGDCLDWLVLVDGRTE